MRRYSFLLVVFLWSCGSQPEADLRSIELVMSDQVDAWNDGDLEAYMSGYWNDPELTFTGGKGITKGWQPALDRYKKAYPTQDQMGILRFEDLSIELLSADAAFATGSWKLDRSVDTLQGRFTLVWKKIEGSWLIIADHSS